MRNLLSPERPAKLLVEEIRVLGSEEKKKERKNIFGRSRGSPDTDAKTGLAMKGAMGMRPWNHLRTLRR